MSCPRPSAPLTLFAFLVTTFVGASASASPCGGNGERACCVGEKSFGACKKGLHEEGKCKRDCKCGNSVFESIGVCRKNKASDPDLPDVPKLPDLPKDLPKVPDLPKDLPKAPDLPKPEPATPCGARGQRACCLGEREGTSCDKGLIELPGCTGDCRCGGLALANSSGTCGVLDAGQLVELAHAKKLVELFGSAKVDRLRAALSKTVLDPANAPKWAGMSAQVNARLGAAGAIIAGPDALKAKIGRDLQPMADDLRRASARMARILDDDDERERIGTLLVAAAEGRFTEPSVQKAIKHLAQFGRKLVPGARGAGTTQGKTSAKVTPAAVSPDTIDTVVEWLPKSFGVTIGWEAGAHVGIAGGFSGGFGFVADFDPTEEIYDIRAIYFLGEGLGIGARAAAFDLGVAALYHLYPSPAKAAPGPSFGAAGGGGTFVTVNAEVEWGFVTRDAARPDDVPRGGVKTSSGYDVLEKKPAVAIGVGMQLDPGAGVLFDIGWTVTFGRPGTGGLCDASGCWDLGY